MALVQPLVAQVGEEQRQLVGGQHALVGHGAARERRDVEPAALLGGLPLGALAHDVGDAVEVEARRATAPGARRGPGRTGAWPTARRTRRRRPRGRSAGRASRGPRGPPRRRCARAARRPWPTRRRRRGGTPCRRRRRAPGCRRRRSAAVRAASRRRWRAAARRGAAAGCPRRRRWWARCPRRRGGRGCAGPAARRRRSRGCGAPGCPRRHRHRRRRARTPGRTDPAGPGLVENSTVGASSRERERELGPVGRREQAVADAVPTRSSRAGGGRRGGSARLGGCPGTTMALEMCRTGTGRTVTRDGPAGVGAGHRRPCCRSSLARSGRRTCRDADRDRPASWVC